MNKKIKYLRTFTIICFMGLLYTSCVKKANYPDVPVITYNSFTPYGGGSITDSALLRINFTDGNGAIGDGQTIDLYIVPLIYIKASQTFQPIFSSPGDTQKFPYVIPNITPSGSDKELSGIIQINFENYLQDEVSILASNPAVAAVADPYSLEFEVWLYDRAGNKSNVLITPNVHTFPEY
jgi:hypothetical protein